ncbi:hypothetical protein D3C76_1597880 [compost metagenome]
MLASAISSDWQSTTDDFAECGQIGFNLGMIGKPGIRLRRTIVETESRNDFVINHK